MQKYAYLLYVSNFNQKKYNEFAFKYASWINFKLSRVFAFNN